MLTAMASLVFVLVLATFQNCTPQKGNGQGYDGMVYSHINSALQPCADGSMVDSTIQNRKGTDYLTRDNCQDIPLGRQISVQSQVTNISPYALQYNGKFYFAWLSIIFNYTSNQNGDLFAAGEGFKILGTGYSQSHHFLAKYGKSSWVKGHLWWDAAPHISTMSDGTLMMAAAVSSIGPAGFGGVWLSHLDAGGNSLWNKSLKLAPGANATRFTVSQAVRSGSGYLILGNLWQANSVIHLVLLQLDLNGELISSKVLSSDFSSSGELVQSNQGDIYLIAQAAGQSAGGNPLIAKLTNQGDVVWADLFTTLDYAKLTISSTGSLLVSGSFLAPVPSAPSIVLPSYRFISLAVDGTVQSTNQWLQDFTIQPRPEVITGPAGDFIAAVQGQNGAVGYVGFDSSFAVKWAINYPLSPDAIYSQTRLEPDGTYIQEDQGASSVLIPNSSTRFTSGFLLRITPGPGCAGCTPLTNYPPAFSPAGALPVTHGQGSSSSADVVVDDVQPPEYIDLLPVLL
jgi:hypothetical protein